MKLRIAILLRSVFGGYLFNSHAQTTASISSMLIFQILFELLLQLPPLSQFQKSSKIPETPHCDLVAERFRKVFYIVSTADAENRRPPEYQMAQCNDFCRETVAEYGIGGYIMI